MRGLVHYFEIVNRSASVTNDEGMTTFEEETEEVEGRVSEVGADEIEAAAQIGQTIDLALAMAVGTNVDDASEVVVSEPSNLAGRYRVVAVRHLPKGLRVLARRLTIRD